MRVQFLYCLGAYLDIIVYEHAENPESSSLPPLRPNVPTYVTSLVALGLQERLEERHVDRVGGGRLPCWRSAAAEGARTASGKGRIGGPASSCKHFVGRNPPLNFAAAAHLDAILGDDHEDAMQGGVSSSPARESGCQVWAPRH